MLVENQKVKVKWIAKNRNHYENKGYVFTKWYEEFDVYAEDLSDGATVEVLFSCDNQSCNKIFSRKYCNYIKGNKTSFCSKKCAQNPEKRIIHTKESLINDFWNFFKEYEKYPLTDDYKYDKNYPDLGAVRRQFGSWNNYLKEVGVVDKNTNDGWYIHDEKLLRKYYPNNEIEKIMDNLMIKRTEQTVRMKANDMGLIVLKDFRYIPKYKNEEVRQTIINDAKEFYMRNNRSPYQYELSFPKNAIEQNWNSYNDFLSECDLPIFRRTVSLKTKEDGILFLENLKKLIGRNPYITELDNYGLNKSWFTRVFGSYKDALYEANLIKIEDIDDEIKLNNSFEGLKKLSKKLNRIPSADDYKKYARDNNLFQLNTLINKTNFNSYVEICNDVLGESNRISYDENELIQNLYELKDKLGRVPMGKELSEHGYPSICIYKTFFNKRYFNDIIRSLGWEPTGHDSLYKSDEELLNDYLNLYDKIGRIPLRDDIDEEENMCHSATYISRFGNLSNLCELLDLNYNDLISDSQMGLGVSCFDDNGEICRSLAEMKLTNILIKCGIKYIKEYPYKKVTKDNFDKRRFDWYLPKFDIYIEYFGLFNKSQINKDNYAGIYTRKTIKKINDCNSLNITLISLFNKDYKNKFKNFESKLLVLTNENSSIKVV